MFRFTHTPHYAQRASIAPPYLAGLVEWYAADQNVTGSNPITRWDPPTVGGLTDFLTKSNGSPQLVQNVFKSGTKPSVRLDATSQFAIHNSATSSSNTSMWGVLKTSSIVASDAIVLRAASSESALCINAGVLVYTEFVGSTFRYTAGSGLNDGNLHTIGCAAVGTSLKFYIDGALASTQSIVGPNFSGGLVGVGSNTVGLVCDLAECASWTTLPTDTQFAHLHNYALGRWS